MLARRIAVILSISIVLFIFFYVPYFLILLFTDKVDNFLTPKGRPSNVQQAAIVAGLKPEKKEKTVFYVNDETLPGYTNNDGISFCLVDAIHTDCFEGEPSFGGWKKVKPYMKDETLVIVDILIRNDSNETYHSNHCGDFYINGKDTYSYNACTETDLHMIIDSNTRQYELKPGEEIWLCLPFSIKKTENLDKLKFEYKPTWLTPGIEIPLTF